METLQKIFGYLIVIISISFSMLYDFGLFPIGLFIFLSILLLVIGIYQWLEKENRSRYRSYIISLIILTILVFIISIFIGRELTSKSQQRADMLVKAITNFYSDRKELPKELEDLKPEYLTKIPKPAILNKNEYEFEYIPLGDSLKSGFILTYYSGLGVTATYNSETGEWIYDD